MTETTLSLNLAHDKQTYSPPLVTRPRFLTFIAQAGIGYTLGSFILVAGQLAANSSADDFHIVFMLPIMLVFGPVLGMPVGLFIWLFDKLSDQPMSRTFRVTIAILILAIGWFTLLLLYAWEAPTSRQQLWLLLSIFVPGIAVGLLSGSALRPGRELIRGGDARGLLPRIIAGFSGSVLRIAVVIFFCVSLIAVITTTPRGHIALGHSVLGLMILFKRMRFEALAVLTVIANIPVVASFWFYPDMFPEYRYTLIGYMVAWALFLVSRWRQTDVAFGVLQEEFRYYLID